MFKWLKGLFGFEDVKDVIAPEADIRTAVMKPVKKSSKKTRTKKKV